MISLSFTICNDCDTITFNDTTGVYDATSNPGGYGDPATNKPIGDWRGSLSVYTKTDSINPVKTWGNLAGGGELDPEDILGVDVDLGTLDDGIYNFIWTITDDDETFETSQFVYFYCDVKTCMRDTITKDINDEANIVLLQILSMFQWELEYCGNYEAADKHREQILELCNTNSQNCD